MKQTMTQHIDSDIRHRKTCSQGCPLELLFPLTAGFWRLRYCDGEGREACARKKTLDRGDFAPDELTPNGVMLFAQAPRIQPVSIKVSTARL